MAESLPDRLRLVRAHFRMSAGDMATRVGLKDRRTWERYERAETRPNADILAYLYGEGINVHWLLSGDGSMLRLEPLPPTAGSGYTQDDRLYEITMATTLRWYETSGLVASPIKLAGLVSRTVRMLRARPDGASQPEAQIAAEVDLILDVARDMLIGAGWTGG